ncbi:MAG: hypothetical protein WCP21_02150 [Armatimonadota bacterium]
MIDSARGLRQTREVGSPDWGREEPVEELHLRPEDAGYRLAYFAVVSERYQTRHVDEVCQTADGWYECKTEGNPYEVRVRVTA